MIDTNKIAELQKYADLSGDELGELCSCLCRLARYTSYCISETFEKALDKEVCEQLENFRNFSEIVEREVTNTQKVAELEWE